MRIILASGSPRRKESDLEAARLALYEEMKHAAKLSVELEVDIHSGLDWYEAK